MDTMTPQTLLKKGAEANLYLTQWHGHQVIIKHRQPKTYRPAQLDSWIRHQRTTREPQLMHEAKLAGVPTPLIFLVDVENAVIVMEYVKGQQVKKVLDSATATERHALCLTIGELIGKLHGYGVVHGDLTTSNMILCCDGKVYLIDFGLGEKTVELEAQGVDLHLLKRALESTHFEFAGECFKAVIEGYANVLGQDAKERVLEKIREIEKRGRYVADRKQDV
jgi:TP53 regulating kinase and related kinases